VYHQACLGKTVPRGFARTEHVAGFLALHVKIRAAADDLTHPIGLVVPEHAVLDGEVAQQ
jgi:hypothetical protein